MNEFNLKPLPDLITEVLKGRNEEKLREFIDKVDLYIIVEESTDVEPVCDSGG